MASTAAVYAKSSASLQPSFLECQTRGYWQKQTNEAPLPRMLLRQQLLLYGRLVRAPDTDPLRRLAFIEGTSEPAAARFVRKVGRPRNTWAAMLQKECLKMGAASRRSIHIQQDWQRAVYQHCVGWGQYHLVLCTICFCAVVVSRAASGHNHPCM